MINADMAAGGAVGDANVNAIGKRGMTFDSDGIVLRGEPDDLLDLSQIFVDRWGGGDSGDFFWTAIVPN